MNTIFQENPQTEGWTDYFIGPFPATTGNPTKKVNQETTEMFISKFEKEDSLWNIMPKSFKNCKKMRFFNDCLELFAMSGLCLCLCMLYFDLA